MSPEILFGLIGAIVGVTTALFSSRQHLQTWKREELKRYADNELKAYAAERDFRHLQRALEQLSTGQNQITKEIELRVDKLELQISDLTGRFSSLLIVLEGKK